MKDSYHKVCDAFLSGTIHLGTPNYKIFDYDNKNHVPIKNLLSDFRFLQNGYVALMHYNNIFKRSYKMINP